MSFFNWASWLRSGRRSQVATYRKKRSRLTRRLNLELLEERTLPSTLPAALISNQKALPTVFANPQSSHPLFDAQVAIDPTNSLHMVAAASYDPTGPTNADP